MAGRRAAEDGAPGARRGAAMVTPPPRVQACSLRFDGWLPLLVGLWLLAGACRVGWGSETALLPTAAATYCFVVAALRAHRQRQLRLRYALDTQNPGLRHVHTEGSASGQPLSWSLAFLEFPLVFDLATEFGFLATFAVPSISSILVGSDSFGNAPQKRESVNALVSVLQ